MSEYVSALSQVFRAAPDKHVAHARSQSILQDMADHPAFLRQALKQHLSLPEALTCHYPVVSILLASTPDFELVANCWLPLNDRATDITTKAIHHHGPMLLTTVTAFGPGYEHWTFATPTVVDEERELFRLEVIENGLHGLGHAAFVDTQVAHVPLYVPSLTVTLALWSSRSATGWKDHVKRIPVVRRRGPMLRKAATAAGLAARLDLKNVEYFDFFPGPDGFVGMRDRIEFKRGPAIDRARSIAHIFQATGNLSLLESLANALQKRRLDDDAGRTKLLTDIATGAEIEPVLSPGHFGIPHANFKRSAIESTLARMSGSSS